MILGTMLYQKTFGKYCLHMVPLCLYLAARTLLFAQETSAPIVPPDVNSITEVNGHLARIGLNKYIELVSVDNSQSLKNLRVRFTENGVRDSSYEKEFESKFGMTVFEKLLMSYSTVSGLPVNEFFISTIQEKGCSYEFRVSKGRLVEGQPAGTHSCIFSTQAAGEAKGAFMLFPFPHHLKPKDKVEAKHIVRGVNDNLSMQCSSVKIIRPTLQPYFASIGAKTSVMEEDEEGTQLVVRELRDQVLRGSKHWEKLTIYGTLWQTTASDDNRTPTVIHFKLLTEGSFAAGVGGYPPDSAFTHNMEPEFYKSLSEYTQQLGRLIWQVLKRSCH
jgi:hypothetical protein